MRFTQFMLLPLKWILTNNTKMHKYKKTNILDETIYIKKIDKRAFSFDTPKIIIFHKNADFIIMQSYVYKCHKIQAFTNPYQQT